DPAISGARGTVTSESHPTRNEHRDKRTRRRETPGLELFEDTMNPPFAGTYDTVAFFRSGIRRQADRDTLVSAWRIRWSSASLAASSSSIWRSHASRRWMNARM